jgi:hypothetical protein
MTTVMPVLRNMFAAHTYTLLPAVISNEIQYSKDAPLNF